MSKFDQIARSLAAVACTLVFSTIMVMGAVGPAAANATSIMRAIA